MKIQSISAISSLLLISSIAIASPEPQKLANFLSITATFVGDGEFMTIEGRLPRSYVSNPKYWGAYVCMAAGYDCHVQDVPRMENGHFILNGYDSLGSQLQVERVDATQGTDIYDAATWQIAIALAAKHNLLDSSTADKYIENVNQRLNRKDVRALGSQFLYGYRSSINDKNAAYTYRMLGREFLAQDPLANSEYSQFIEFTGDTKDEAKLFGRITWSDWKPISGENAWAFFIGPLQADHLRYGNQAIPFQSASIQNALKILPTVKLMQAGNGGIYYAPKGSDGNEGPIPDGTISTENTLSMYAGLSMFKKVLINTRDNDPAAPVEKIDDTINVINGILEKTECYLKENAFNLQTKEFIQGGVYSDGQWQPEENIKAVDVNTWGIAALTPKKIDEWYGKGVAYQIWQSTKRWGAYHSNESGEQVAGVGFSDQDNHQILSGEWTFGAITAVRELKNYYEQSKTISDSQLKSLTEDLHNMQKQIETLRTDNYIVQSSQVDGIAKEYQVSLPNDQAAYLYANKRYHIPFGWYANPIPSIASSSWAMMSIYGVNPFQLS